MQHIPMISDDVYMWTQVDLRDIVPLGSEQSIFHNVEGHRKNLNEEHVVASVMQVLLRAAILEDFARV